MIVCSWIRSITFAHSCLLHWKSVKSRAEQKNRNFFIIFLCLPLSLQHVSYFKMTICHSIITIYVYDIVSAFGICNILFTCTSTQTISSWFSFAFATIEIRLICNSFNGWCWICSMFNMLQFVVNSPVFPVPANILHLNDTKENIEQHSIDIHSKFDVH